MYLSTKKKYYNRCNASEALAPNDERNLDIDAFDAARVRGDNWVSRLANAIELSDEPVCLLFTGLPGSGISTELRRLAQRLKDPQRAELLPVLIDGDASLDLTNEIDIPDIIAAIMLGVEKAVLEVEGKDPATALETGYFTKLWSWLTTTEIELTKAEFAIPGGGPKLVTEMRSRPTLRARVRATLATHLSSFLEDVREELRLLENRAKVKGYRGIVVIFDSLEKLRGSNQNWPNVLASAERIFSSGAPYLKLPVHVLYTVPTALINRHLFKSVHFIPMIKLCDRDGRPWAPGYAAARELVRRRLPDDIARQVFGELLEARIADLIRWSGGYPRELVRLLQSALAHENLPLAENDFQRIFNELKDAYRKVIPADAFAWLAKVAHERYYTVEEEKQRQIADQMLLNNAVLRYVNDNDWYDLHPAVAEIPGIRQALQAHRAPVDAA